MIGIDFAIAQRVETNAQRTSQIGLRRHQQPRPAIAILADRQIEQAKAVGIARLASAAGQAEIKPDVDSVLPPAARGGKGNRILAVHLQRVCQSDDVVPAVGQYLRGRSTMIAQDIGQARNVEILAGLATSRQDGRLIVDEAVAAVRRGGTPTFHQQGVGAGHRRRHQVRIVQPHGAENHLPHRVDQTPAIIAGGIADHVEAEAHAGRRGKAEHVRFPPILTDRAIECPVGRQFLGGCKVEQAETVVARIFGRRVDRQRIAARAKVEDRIAAKIKPVGIMHVATVDFNAIGTAQRPVEYGRGRQRVEHQLRRFAQREAVGVAFPHRADRPVHTRSDGQRRRLRGDGIDAKLIVGDRRGMDAPLDKQRIDAANAKLLPVDIADRIRAEHFVAERIDQPPAHVVMHRAAVEEEFFTRIRSEAIDVRLARRRERSRNRRTERKRRAEREIAQAEIIMACHAAGRVDLQRIIARAQPQDGRGAEIGGIGVAQAPGAHNLALRASQRPVDVSRICQAVQHDKCFGRQAEAVDVAFARLRDAAGNAIRVGGAQQRAVAQCRAFEIQRIEQTAGARRGRIGHASGDIGLAARNIPYAEAVDRTFPLTVTGLDFLILTDQQRFARISIVVDPDGSGRLLHTVDKDLHRAAVTVGNQRDMRPFACRDQAAPGLDRLHPGCIAHRRPDRAVGVDRDPIG